MLKSVMRLMDSSKNKLNSKKKKSAMRLMDSSKNKLNSKKKKVQ